MSIRSLARSIARARMQHAGVEQMNKKRFTDNSASGKRIKGLRSYFAMNWRKYLDPTTQEYKRGTRNVTFRKKSAFANRFAPKCVFAAIFARRLLIW